MTADAQSLRHNALVYDSQEEYVQTSVAFLREGLEAGEGAIVAHTRSGLALMREALGSDAEHVRFVDVSYSYTRPARTLAAYHAVYTEELETSSSVRAVADVQFGPDDREWELWMGYESVFNRSFGHLPTWVLCTYDVSGLPDSMIEGVWRTHPEVVVENGWKRSDLYEDPDAFLRRVRNDPTPLPELRAIGLGRDLEEFRERLARELVAAGVTEPKALDMLLAATEVARNAIEHGGGVEEVLVGTADGRFVCEIVDRGSGFDEPTAGYLAPRDGLGRGLWVARQLTWQIDFFQSLRGFTARISL
jgi:anti-sigma regulatory factor (Ser/Thr protein kinase)